MHAIVVLGMHRSGTSCIAGMLAAGGAASAGASVRNWDNARGHHEMLDVVRLNEAVLAHSGGHWLSLPREVTWTEAHAHARDHILRLVLDGAPALVKDPRTLLVLPFWRASAVPFREIAVVRHPLAVARSLASWRGMPLGDGIALWTAHNRALLADRAQHAYPLVDFDAPRAEVIAAVAAFAPADPAAFEDQLVHHDAGDAPDLPGLAEALEIHRALVGEQRHVRRGFPGRELSLALAAEPEQAVVHARAALAQAADAGAILVPLTSALVRRRAYAAARDLIAEHAARLDPGLADLLLGKVLLAAGDAAAAVRHLEAACATASPFFQARQLLPQALHASGRHVEARATLEQLAADALYPHGPLSTLAEWSWLDGDRARAIAELRRAIEAAPQHRRGRLRTRLAEWLLERGEPGAREQLEAAIAEDPGYTRSRELLARLP
ncbi:MAG: hypothetical protein JO257_26800 [Deltaproteobacteria bacterium]|nr:hypothetical protein [Deltaproteobacteria bacterium]